MTYEQDRAEREQDATEAMIRMRDTSEALKPTAKPMYIKQPIVWRLRSIEHADVPQKYLMLEAAIEIERLQDAIKDLVSRGNAHLAK